MPADPLERFIVRKVREAHESDALGVAVEKAIRAREAIENPSTGGEVQILRRRVQQIDRALGSAGHRVLMAENDAMAQALLDEAEKLRRERAGLVARVEAMEKAQPTCRQKVGGAGDSGQGSTPAA